MANKLSIKQLEKKEHIGFQSSKLVLLIEGSDTSPALLNSIRRCSLEYVPTYAFSPLNIDIEENGDIWTNDMIKLRISQMTIPNINNPNVNFDEVHYAQINNDPIEGEKDIRIYVDITNDSNDILNVTTNEMRYYEDNIEKIVFDKKYPLLLTKLRPRESFKFNAKATLGVALAPGNDIWAAASNTYYEYDNESDNKYVFTIESQGQLDEYDIIDRCIVILIEKFIRLKQLLNTEYSSADIEKKNTIILKLEEESFTIGNILNHNLQNSNDIIFSGINRPDLLQNDIILKIVSKKLNPIPIILNTIDDIIKIYENFNKLINKLGSKYIPKH